MTTQNIAIPQLPQLEVMDMSMHAGIIIIHDIDIQ